MKNCKEAGQSIPNSNYVDPFVGTSRYVPNSGGSGAQVGFSSENCDPFTGKNYIIVGLEKGTEEFSYKLLIVGRRRSNKNDVLRLGCLWLYID